MRHFDAALTIQFETRAPDVMLTGLFKEESTVLLETEDDWTEQTVDNLVATGKHTIGSNHRQTLVCMVIAARG
jgi:MarR-like DNA-binding transcriptional regulator SgrR of sgrS sRNA